MRLQDEIKQKQIDKLLVDKSTQKTEMLDKSIQKSEMLNKSTQKSIAVDKNGWVDWNDVGTQTDAYLLNIPPHEDFDLYPGPEVLSYYNYKYIFIKQYDKIHKTTQMIRIQNDTWERVKELLFLASFGVFNYVGTAVGYFIWQFNPTPVPIGIPIGLFTSTFLNLINLITLMPSVTYIHQRGVYLMDII